MERVKIFRREVSDRTARGFQGENEMGGRGMMSNGNAELGCSTGETRMLLADRWIRQTV